MNTTTILKQNRHQFCAMYLFFFLLTLSGCYLKREDVGPYQPDQRTYALTSFDRLDMGSAFVITVQQGAVFSITVEGDRRNLDDLDVYTRNGTLKAQYRIARSRTYPTTFHITMPTLRSVDFSGASRSTITGFTNLSDLDISLSGASECQFVGQATRTTVDLSGASSLQLSGLGTWLSAGLSGASSLEAFGFPVANAGVDASGASKANVSVNTTLVVEASGASTIRYRGAPVVSKRVSGASTVQGE
jgi:hypothetical protein